MEALRISHGDRLLKNRVAELTKQGGRVAAFQSTAEEGCGDVESTEEGFQHVKELRKRVLEMQRAQKKNFGTSKYVKSGFWSVTAGFRTSKYVKNGFQSVTTVYQGSKLNLANG